MRRRAILVICAAGLSCGGSDRPGRARAAVIRDSVGVRVVETASPSRLRAPVTVGEEPTFVVGETDGDPRYLLSRVVGATQLADGDVLVASGGSNELRLYDARGRFLRSQVGKGRGRASSATCARSDTAGDRGSWRSI